MRGRGALARTVAALAAALAPSSSSASAGSRARLDLGFPSTTRGSICTSRATSPRVTGFAYNPGVPVAGSTAPLWTLAARRRLFAIGRRHPALGQGCGHRGGAGHRVAARGASRAVDGRRGARLDGGARHGVDAGRIVWGALSGMEVSLAALLVTGALVAHAAGRVAMSAALVGLAALARPEAVLVSRSCGWAGR